jgi:tRNA A37 threonylcarbamoyladenosine dehydratase
MKNPHHENAHERFVRLVGPEQLNMLQNKHVMIAGIGGVGSWAAEALARSFIGQLTLIDFDRVAASNINRQLIADTTTIGIEKVSIMADRLRRISPQTQFHVHPIKLTKENIPALFAENSYDYVIDAIDELEAKCALIHYCYQNGIKLVVSTGAAGRFNPGDIRVTDLATTKVDRLGRAVRRLLKKHYGLGHGPYGIKAICSRETLQSPLIFPGEDEEKRRKDIPNGTACFVTASFGMYAASVVVRELLGIPVPTGMNA